MKEEDKLIHFRPNVAKLLQEAMDYAIQLYNVNIRKNYYTILSSLTLEEAQVQQLLSR